MNRARIIRKGRSAPRKASRPGWRARLFPLRSGAVEHGEFARWRCIHTAQRPRTGHAGTCAMLYWSCGSEMHVPASSGPAAVHNVISVRRSSGISRARRSARVMRDQTKVWPVSPINKREPEIGRIYRGRLWCTRRARDKGAVFRERVKTKNPRKRKYAMIV